jgi:hypothetical protein
MRIVVTRVLKVPECVALAQPDGELALPWSRRRHQVNGSDRIVGTHRLKSSAAAVPAAVHKGRPGMEAENERLRKRLAKAEVKLGQTRAALDIMGKAFALLELLSGSADSPGPSAR